MSDVDERPDFAKARAALDAMPKPWWEAANVKVIYDALDAAESQVVALTARAKAAERLLRAIRFRMRARWRHGDRCTQEPCTCGFREAIDAIAALAISLPSASPTDGPEGGTP